MAETLTVNFGWTKPDPGASANTWGTTLNATTDKIDAQCFSNQQAGLPVGAMAMWPTPTPPANWLICNGQSLSQTGTYAGLFALLGTTFNQAGDPIGSFRVPNLSGAFPIGAGTGYGLASTGGAATVTLDPTMIPAHIHPATASAPTVTATQAAHSHVISTGGHSHTISTGSHAHSLGSQVLTPNAGANASAGAGWGFNTIGTSTVGDLGGSTSAAGNLGGGTDSQAPAITASASAPTVTVNANTGGAAHPNLPPYLSVNFIIKFA